MTQCSRSLLITTLGLLAAIVITPASAHVGHGLHGHIGGLHAGFVHPWSGIDHLLAMVLVGLLAVRARSTRALFLIPAGFVGGMLIGGALFYWVPSVAPFMPVVEMAIAASVIVLGLAVAFLPRITLVPAVLLVALAGSFHGGAHVYEMTGAVAPYILGMALATALLHALGVGAGLILGRIRADVMERVAGGALACTFVVALLV